MAAKQRYSLLIVDRSSADRAFYRRCLNPESNPSYDIWETGLAAEALHLVEQERPEVILLDYGLPDGDGLQLLEQLLKLFAQQPDSASSVIMVAAQGNEALAVQALKAGAQNYLSKDQLTPEQLRQAVGQALSHNQLMRQMQAEIAQRQATEAHLRSSEAFKQQLLDSSPDCIKVLDLEGRLLSINRSGLDIMEIGDFEIYRGQPWTGFWQGAHLEAAEQALNQAQTGETVSFRGECTTAAGVKKWWEVKIAPVIGEVGQFEQLLVVSRDVSASQQGLLKLRRSEQRSRKIIDSLFSFIGIVDLEGILIEANQTALQAADLSADDVIGQPFEQTYWWSHDSEVQGRLRQAIDQALAGEIVRYDAVVQVRDQQLVTIDFTLVPVLDETGQVEYLIPSGIDITERRQGERELQESRAIIAQQLIEIEAIYHQAPIGLMVLDPELRFARINQRLAEINGFSIETHLGKTLREVLPDLADTAEPQLRQVLETGEPVVNIELKGETPAQPGVERIWLESWYPLHNSEGNITGINVVAQEVTEQKQFTNALANSEQRYRTLFESIDEGFCIIEVLLDDQATPMDYRFIEVNPVFEQQTGLNNPVGKTAKQLVPDLEEDWIDLYGQVALTGEAKRFEQGSVAMGRYFEVYACRLGDAAARQVAIVFKNMTDRKRDEIERDRLLAQAKAAQKEAETANQIKDDFLAIVSHELRTPLNPILGWSQLLSQGKLNPTQTLKALDTIQRNAKLQSQLIDDLLDISRILRGKLSLDPKAVNLAQVVQASIGTVQLSAEAKAITMHLQVEPDLDPVRGDAGRLQQVIWNLLSNAIKFTPQGGEVHVQLKQTENHACLSIRDTGKGISPQFLPHVFQRFRQADSATTRQFGGLGLGLAIVRNLVELHGGAIEVDSLGENQGATFTVKLPLMLRGSSTAQAMATSEGSTTNLGGYSILLVDDDTDAREVATFVLEDAGAKVTAVASAQEALSTINKSRFDVLLSDIGMPEMDGYELAQSIRTLPPEAGGEIQAIALTAFASEIDFRRARAAGFNLHLAKPIEPQVLVDAIAHLLVQTQKNSL